MSYLEEEKTILDTFKQIDIQSANDRMWYHIAYALVLALLCIAHAIRDRQPSRHWHA